jgi:hypothetical protein
VGGKVAIYIVVAALRLEREREGERDDRRLILTSFYAVGCSSLLWSLEWG